MRGAGTGTKNPFSDRVFNNNIRAIAASPSAAETLAMCCGSHWKNLRYGIKPS